MVNFATGIVRGIVTSSLISQTGGRNLKKADNPTEDQAAAVEPASETVSVKPSAEVVGAYKTGAVGDDKSPQVRITVNITNLPKEAASLSAFVYTNQEWQFGATETDGKTSGNFKFTGYVSPNNYGVNNKLFIKIYSDNGDSLGRIPSDEGKYIKFIPIKFHIKD